MTLELAMFGLGLFLGGIIGTAIHLWNIRRLALNNQQVWRDYLEQIKKRESSGWGRE